MSYYGTKIKIVNSPVFLSVSIEDPAGAKTAVGRRLMNCQINILKAIEEAYGIFPSVLHIEFPLQPEIPTSEVGNE